MKVGVDAGEGDYRLRIKVQNNRLATAIELAGYATVASFCRACGVPQTDVGKFLNLRESAVRSDGTWRATAVKIAEFLNFELPDLFPEDLQTLELKRNEMLVAMTADQVAALSHDDPVREYSRQQTNGLLMAAIGRLKPRDAAVIKARFGIGRPEATMEAIGEELGVGRERVRQLEARALRELRRAAGAGLLVDHSEDA